MRNRTNLIILITMLFLPALLFWGCKKKDEVEKTNVSVKGSDTMVNLSQRWAEVYMEKNPDVSMTVTGGGSGTGIASLINGTLDIANASREMKENEIEKAKQNGVNPVQFEVALDGIAVIVNPDNPIDSLTVQEISDIFTGNITNWNKVGGPDKEITLYGRENSSGTYEFFKEHVLGENEMGKQSDFSTATQVLQGTAALGEAVARDDKGIGYGGVGYFAEREDVKILYVKENNNSKAIAPAHNGNVNYDAIWDGSYSISRYLYCYTSGEPTGAVEKFMDFIMSSEGQKVVKGMEYIPLPGKIEE